MPFVVYPHLSACTCLDTRHAAHCRGCHSEAAPCAACNRECVHVIVVEREMGPSFSNLNLNLLFPLSVNVHLARRKGLHCCCGNHGSLCHLQDCHRGGSRGGFDLKGRGTRWTKHVKGLIFQCLSIRRENGQQRAESLLSEQGPRLGLLRFTLGHARSPSTPWGRCCTGANVWTVRKEGGRGALCCRVLSHTQLQPRPHA